jgi:sporulation protein YlmC with PRC-barrel domain
MMLILQRSAASVVSILLLTSGIARAQIPARPIAVESKSVPTGAHSPTVELGSPVFRASQLKGIRVENRAGEEVGKIYDLVIDPRSGKTAYIALSVGGFLGMGDKLFAIPYDVFTFVPGELAPNHNSNQANDIPHGEKNPAITPAGKFTDVIAVLDISKEALQKAEGFDQKMWPNMVDASWRTANDKAYQSLPRRTLNRSGEPVATEVARASEWIGTKVVNAQNETVGEIDDLMVDDADGHVRYAALSVGGFLGLGAKLFAIPMSAFTISKDANGKETVQLPVTKESFKGIDGFDKDHWPNLADKSWRDRNDQGYQSWMHSSK